MSFRTIIIKSRVKLELSLGYLVCRGEMEKKVHLGEISTLIIQTTAASITIALLSELASRNIKVIFCDSKCNPQSELISYYPSHNPCLKMMEQFKWQEGIKGIIWKEIVSAKICNQARVLEKQNKIIEKSTLEKYVSDILEHDLSNREGHAAKVYFNAIFGPGFSRGADCDMNSFLNYGYAILLSAFNRAIAEYGFYTQIGIHHKNEYNYFNLSCDFMEPFRPIMDDYIISKGLTLDNFKRIIVDFLNMYVYIGGKKLFMDYGIKIYVLSILSSLESGNISISFPDKYEL